MKSRTCKITSRRFRAYLRLLRMHHHSNQRRRLSTDDHHRLRLLEAFLKVRCLQFEYRHFNCLNNPGLGNDYNWYIRLILANDELCEQLFIEYECYTALLSGHIRLYQPFYINYLPPPPARSRIVLRI